MIQQGVEAHGQLIAAVAVATAIAYFVLGKFALMIAAGSLLLAYIFRGPLFRVLDRFELKGVALAVAATILPFIGGPVAWVGGAFAGISILAYEWQHFSVWVDLSQINQDLQIQNTTLQTHVNTLDAHVKKVEATVAQAIGQNPQLQAIWDQLNAGAAATAQAQTRYEALEASLTKFHAFYQDVVTGKADVVAQMQKNAALEELHRTLSQDCEAAKLLLASLTEQIAAVQQRDAAATEQFGAQVQRLGVQVDRVESLFE
jgi:lambda repressor-like predicted transcriptional regulator